MSLNPDITLATKNQIPVLAAVERAAGQLFPPGRIPDTEHTLSVAELTESFNQNLLFVATVKAEVVGFACCKPQTGYIHLEELAVHPSFGKRGIGRALVTRVIEESTARKQRGVTLTTFRDLPFNGPFYAKMGFSYLEGEEVWTELRLILDAEEAMNMEQRVAMAIRTTDYG